MLIDSHAHLDFAEFEGEAAALVARARAAGVDGILTIATRREEWDQVVKTAEQFDGVWCALGAHPHEARDHADLAPQAFAAFAAHPKVVGIGETGLDFHYDHSPRELQERVFRAHIAAAKETGLPLVIHAREADDAIARILEEERPPAAVLHSFTGGRKLAQQALSLGAYISISGIVTFKSAANVRAVAAEVPLHRLLVETDCPYLAPVPYRGKTNEPAFVAATAAFLAAAREIEPEALAAATSENFFRLFQKAERPQRCG